MGVFDSPVDPATATETTIFFGTILHFKEDPWIAGHEGQDDTSAYELHTPGALVIQDGHVAWAGLRGNLPARYKTGASEYYSGGSC